ANSRMLAENLMASVKVLYVGHAVAAVAATDPNIAEDALKLIEVDYEVLPPVLDVREAMKDDAPVLHEDMTTMFKVERLARGEHRDDDGCDMQRAREVGEGDPARALPRLRCQAGHVPRPDRRAAFEEDRPAREDGHVAQGSAGSDRSDLRDVHALQDRREERR